MKKASTIIKIIASALLFVWGIIIMFFGISDNTSFYFYGNYTANETYGGDAYTGIQNAAADTANNISELGNAIDYSISKAYTWVGIIAMIVALYLFACTLAKIEFKKKASNDTDTLETLTKYQELLNSGIITQEEFDAKKKQLLGF